MRYFENRPLEYIGKPFINRTLMVHTLDTMRFMKIHTPLGSIILCDWQFICICNNITKQFSLELYTHSLAPCVCFFFFSSALLLSSSRLFSTLLPLFTLSRCCSATPVVFSQCSLSLTPTMYMTTAQHISHDLNWKPLQMNVTIASRAKVSWMVK